MALTDSIMSLFGRGPQTPAPAPAATPGVQQQQVAGAAANPAVPSPATPQSTGSVAAIPPAGQGDQSPLANFQDLWKADPNANQQTPSLVPAFNLDHQGLMDAAKKVNFTGHISQDLVTKAMSGDATAFLDVINQATQLGFANATAASGTLVQQSLGSAQGVLKDSVLPAAFREQQISQAMTEANPVFSDPAVAPMLGMLKTQLQSKYPTSSPAEIAAMATQYLGGLSQKVVQASGSSIVSKQQGNQGQLAHNDTNWETYFAS